MRYMEKTKTTIKRVEFYEDEKLVRVEEETVEEREETPDPKPYQWPGIQPTQPYFTVSATTTDAVKYIDGVMRRSKA